MIDKDPAYLRLLSGKKIVLQRWMDRCRDEISAADGVEQFQLQNAIPSFLDALALALNPASRMKDANDENEIAKDHGTQRLEIGDYSLYEVLLEYKILRQVILIFLEEVEPVSKRDLDVILDSIEEAMAEAGMQFAELEKARSVLTVEKLEKSNIALEHFAAIAAHDLKSPIATISGFIEILELEFGPRIRKEAADHLQFIRSASIRMCNLIDRLLDYSTLSSHSMVFKPVDMNVVLDIATSHLNSKIEELGATVEYKNLPTVNGDIALLIQLVQNLISNSLKFADKKPFIHVSVKDMGVYWEFGLRDNGVGFDPRHKEEIFALYKKLHRASEFQGTGIGLASCKKVVEIHSGKIWAESEPLKGATFYFTLPKNL